jgi:hypothetical protein
MILTVFVLFIAYGVFGIPGVLGVLVLGLLDMGYTIWMQVHLYTKLHEAEIKTQHYQERSLDRLDRIEETIKDLQKNS